MSFRISIEYLLARSSHGILNMKEFGFHNRFGFFKVEVLDNRKKNEA